MVPRLRRRLITTIHHSSGLKVCVLYFLFYQKEAFQKLKQVFFISSKKLLLFLRYSTFCNFFSFLHRFSRFKGTDETGIIMLEVGLHKLANEIFWNN